MGNIDHRHTSGYINEKYFHSKADCRKLENGLTGKPSFYFIKKQQRRNLQKCHNRQNSSHVLAGAADSLYNLKHKAVKNGVAEKYACYGKIDGGVGYGFIFERDEDYMAPVTAHYGYNNVEQYGGDPENPSALIGGCTFEDRSKIVYIDELDEEDNVNVRLEKVAKYRTGDVITPEVEWCGDRVVMLTMMLPTNKRVAEAAAVELGKKLGLVDPEVINAEVMQEAEGTRIELKGRVDFDIDLNNLVIPPEPHYMTDQELYDEFEGHEHMKVVCGTVGEDEHSVGMREIINIKHGGIEKWGIECVYLGTSVPVEKMVDACIEENAQAILASTIISHDNVHYKNMKRLHELCVEKGIRDKVIICAGGTQVIPEEAVKTGIDMGFGRNSHGIDVATFLAEERQRRRGERK